MGDGTQLAKTGEMASSVKKYALKYILPYHREIARRLVLGQKQCDIARDLGINAGRLCIVCNSPAMLLEVKKLEDMRNSGVIDVAEQIQELQPVALETLERTMVMSSNDKLRVDIAQDLLDRGGHAKVTKVEGNIVHETHEQRIARFMGIPPGDVYIAPPKKETTIINVTPTNAHAVSNSDPILADLGDRGGDE